MDLQVHRIISFTEDVAVGLRQFREHLPEYSAEITNVIAELYAISATLTSLEGLTRQFPRNFGPVKADFDRVLVSLRYTLNEIINSFGKLDRRPTADNYRQIWHDLNAYLLEESGYSLKRRLNKYKLFLQELQDVVQNKTVDFRFLANLRKSIMSVLEEQDGRFAARLAGLSLDPPGSPTSSSSFSGGSVDAHAGGVGKRRSYERTRPGFRPQPSPLHSPTSTNDSAPPWAPDVPGSPISTSTTTQSNLSSAILNDHWAKDVFSYRGPMIKLPMTGESSKCLGDDVQDVKEWLHEQGFDEIAYISFDDKGSGLSVFFYVREQDNRARILCKSRRNRRAHKYYCLPLNMLEVRRVESCLQLCRRRRAGTELVPWLNLQFDSIEKMVIFFCAFLALRSQDGHKRVQDIRDCELDSEKELFGGIIDDDNFIHALRIYRDRISGAIRLQASVHEGDMKRAPVWTAFITRSIDSPYWIRRVNNRVLLREIRQVIFFPEYSPPRTSRGEHILKFTSEDDARDFVDVIERLSITD
ncbi:conserved hypothetical protein [Talaromyces stipitatus ATCC 10500]|uniref:Uncharacterized protein n=1 Tax=Talaromyces stipitatus (strain ATCC 10500 / CBS 375.48 / QM 6759 / NRRL 1006) TaxID=441959 RepID=B8M597_TALSN|nr:uncharacterized protein TSTA_029760 [Talaromyces stipitatus ATCC 10500]EED19703.1 conserved hypothetical protein [Talaromyces stipitatus ATCC 10500]